VNKQKKRLDVLMYILAEYWYFVHEHR